LDDVVNFATSPRPRRIRFNNHLDVFIDNVFIDNVFIDNDDGCGVDHHGS
jgi:hypothetical protein